MSTEPSREGKSAKQANDDSLLQFLSRKVRALEQEAKVMRSKNAASEKLTVSLTLRVERAERALDVLCRSYVERKGA